MVLLLSTVFVVLTITNLVSSDVSQNERLRKLEDQVVTQQLWLQELQETVKAQQDIITKLNSQVQQYAQETKDCNVEVTKLKDTVALQDQRISKLKKYSRYGMGNGPNAGESTGKNASRHGQLSLRNSRNDVIRVLPSPPVITNDESVAFQAVMVGHGPTLRANQNVNCDTVVFNMGGGYNKQNGVFTAPARGIYAFSTTVTIKHPSNVLQVDIEKNGQEIAGCTAFGTGEVDSHDQCSVTVVVLLEIGDRVYVRTERHNSISVYGDKLTSFSGLIVVPL